jgi:hypothetical protein
MCYIIRLKSLNTNFLVIIYKCLPEKTNITSIYIYKYISINIETSAKEKVLRDKVTSEKYPNL